MLSVQDQKDLFTKSKDALARIQNGKKEQQELKNESTWRRPNYSKLVLEEYESSLFDDKIRTDSAYYNVLFKRFDESQSENLHKILGSMMSTVRSIYEQINIKPKIYGLSRLPSLNNTDSDIQENATLIISDYINRNYYKLSREQRQDKYEEGVKALASDMVVQESIDPEEAVRFSTKVIVVKQFLENINFPLVVRGEVENCLTSNEYGEMFEQDKLRDLWESFDKQSLSLAKVIASVV